MSDAKTGEIDLALPERVRALEEKLQALTMYLSTQSHMEMRGALTMELAMLLSTLDDRAGAREHYMSRVPVRRGW